MDDRWKLELGDDVLWVESEAGEYVRVFIDDGTEGLGVRVTSSEACRIALELLRRSKVMPHPVLRLVEGCLPPVPTPTG